MHESKLRRQCGLAPFRRRRHADRLPRSRIFPAPVQPTSTSEKCSVDLAARMERPEGGQKGCAAGRSIARPAADSLVSVDLAEAFFFCESSNCRLRCSPRLPRRTESCIWSRSGADDGRNRFSLFLPLSLFSFPSIQCSNPPLLTSRRGSSTERPLPTEPSLSHSPPPALRRLARIGRTRGAHSLARPLASLSSVCLPLASEIGNQIRLSHRAYPLVPLSVNSSFRNTMDLSPSALRPF